MSNMKVSMLPFPRHSSEHLSGGWSLQPEVLKERGAAVLEVVNFARADAQQRVQESDEFHMYDELAADTNFSF